MFCYSCINTVKKKTLAANCPKSKKPYDKTNRSRNMYI